MTNQVNTNHLYLNYTDSGAFMSSIPGVLVSLTLLNLQVNYLQLYGAFKNNISVETINEVICYGLHETFL